MRRPRTGVLLLVATLATCLVGIPAQAASGLPSSGPEPVTAENRTSLELYAEAYALQAHNAQRRAGSTRAGATFGDVSRTSTTAAWTDMMTVSRRWADRLSRSYFEHNPNYGEQYGHWRRAAENIAYATVYPRGDTPTRSEVEETTERIMQMWWRSEGHRQNWMDPRHDHASIGVSVRPVAGERFWIVAAVANFRTLSGTVPSTWRSFPTDGSLPPNEVDSGARFRDVPRSHTFHDQIEALARSGITSGCGGGAYCPDDAVTRGQMAAFLDRALGLRSGSHSFADARGHQFESSIAALARAEITLGCNPPANTRFCPDRPVTRGQMAAFLERALDLARGNGTFSDTRGHTFEDPISALARAEITVGCNPPANTRFCPDEVVTRAQMAAFLDRAGLTD